jgi:hypothetical protein
VFNFPAEVLCANSEKNKSYVSKGVHIERVNFSRSIQASVSLSVDSVLSKRVLGETENIAIA